MFDCHYDLLTYIYMNKNNLKEVKRYCKKIFKDNITGGIFNLFYMSPQEMRQELNIKKEEINIIENLKVVSGLIKEENLIPKDIKYIYGIEGLDYLENIDGINEIYNLGVRSVNIVWNNDNKFGGGAKGNKKRGLTSLGEELIKKLADKKIAIDLSHANEKTFYDIINLCNELKRKGKNPIVLASHSNLKSLCNVPRNLSDDQIVKIKELDGVIGIVGVKPFCIKEDRFNKDKKKYYNAYIEHIKYVRDLLGGVDNIAVSTDDMTYYETKYYKYFNVFKQKNMKKKLEDLLFDTRFNKNEIEKILYINVKNKILERL
ncbi:MAG: dipeptidase [Clostridia bacterium]|nr:dipeptidase [Clostridia bacterium]